VLVYSWDTSAGTGNSGCTEGLHGTRVWLFDCSCGTAAVAAGGYQSGTACVIVLRLATTSLTHGLALTATRAVAWGLQVDS
jgi:hypothetical protein